MRPQLSSALCRAFLALAVVLRGLAALLFVLVSIELVLVLLMLVEEVVVLLLLLCLRLLVLLLWQLHAGRDGRERRPRRTSGNRRRAHISGV